MKSKNQKSSTAIAHALVGAVFLAGLSVVACEEDIERHSDSAKAQDEITDRTGPSSQPMELTISKSDDLRSLSADGIDVPVVDSEGVRSAQQTPPLERRATPFVNTEIAEELRRDLESAAQSSANPYESRLNAEASSPLISEAVLNTLRQNAKPVVTAEFERELKDGLELAASGRVPAEFERELADGLEAANSGRIPPEFQRALEEAASGRIPPEFESLLTDTPSSSERSR